MRSLYPGNRAQGDSSLTPLGLATRCRGRESAAALCDGPQSSITEATLQITNWKTRAGLVPQTIRKRFTDLRPDLALETGVHALPSWGYAGLMRPLAKHQLLRNGQLVTASEGSTVRPVRGGRGLITLVPGELGTGKRAAPTFHAASSTTGDSAIQITPAE